MESAKKERSLQAVPTEAGTSRTPPPGRWRKRKKNGKNHGTAQPTVSAAPATDSGTAKNQKNDARQPHISQNPQPQRSPRHAKFMPHGTARSSEPSSNEFIWSAAFVESRNWVKVQQSAAPKDDGTAGWEVDDASASLDPGIRDFWERSSSQPYRRRRHRKKNRSKNSLLHPAFATPSAGGSGGGVAEERENDHESSSGPDVVSLPDEDRSDSKECDDEHGQQSIGSNDARWMTSCASEEYYRQLETFSKEPLVAELKNAAVCDGTKGRKVVVSSVLVEENADGAVISEDAENFANFVGNIEWQTSENVSDSKVTAIVGQPTEQEIDNASITEPEDRLNKNESSLPEKPAFFSKASIRNGPLIIKGDPFDGIELAPGIVTYVQNGEIELKIEKPEGRDFMQLLLFECSGPPEDPKQVARGGYKICTSAVLHEDTPVETVHEALIDLAKQLEQVSRDSFVPGDKLPYEINKYSLPYLERHCIYPLKKKSARFTRAVYHCRVCQYHICSILQAVSHFTSREHVDNAEKSLISKKLECLPVPLEGQVSKVDQIIRQKYIFTRLTDTDYETGKQIAISLSQLLQKVHKDYSLVIYGSYYMKLSTAGSSNLNLALNYPLELSLGSALSRITGILEDIKIEKDFSIRSITCDFQRADPSINCIVNSVPVVIATNCIRQQRTTQLINLYCTVRPQFRILAVVFRSWAEECSLTNMQLGGIPKAAFDIMLIYYLQKKGFLPFVFEILSEEELLLLDSESLEFDHQVDKINFVFGANNEEWNFGELWISLFRYYVVEHPVEKLIQIRWKDASLPERYNKKRLAIEDPFCPDRTIQPQQHIYGYFSSCFLSTYLHFAMPRTASRSLIPYTIIRTDKCTAPNRKIRKHKLLKSVYDSVSGEPVTANQKGEDASTAHNTSDLCEDLKSLAVSEVVATEIDLPQNTVTVQGEVEAEVMLMKESSKSLNPAVYALQQQEPDGTVKHLDDGYLSKPEEDSKENSIDIGTCKELEIPVCDQTITSSDISTSHNELPVLEEPDNSARRYNRDIMMLLQGCDSREPEICLRLKELGLLSTNGENMYGKKDDDEQEVASMIKLASMSSLIIKFENFGKEDISEFWSHLRNNDFAYPWELHFFTSDLAPVVRCTCCALDGHLREQCPDLYVPPARELPPLTCSQRRMINKIIYDVFEQMHIKQYYIDYMSSLCHELENCLRRFYRPDCRLSLFGSAGNGFGLLGSDADLCLRFGPEVKPEELDPVEVITKVAEVVRNMPCIANVSEIINAKVPIVKFRCYNRGQLEADVSLYNVLALENTRLLRAYSDLDRRIQWLGIMIKEWAKNCEIGDASRGSLSSYAFIIMLIHYLQRTNPPVAPFLQEVAPFGKRREPVMVDNCDVYFCDPRELGWRILNRSSVGELWFGFLDYFARKFDFAQEVIQIRQTEPLMKLDKGWQLRPIAIEDPFDLNHNLSSGVHSKTMVYIRKSFIQSRERFGTMVVPFPHPVGDAFVRYASFLLRSCRVGDGPPLDRNCCHRCRQIGHFVENCPLGLKVNKRISVVKSARTVQSEGNGRHRHHDAQSLDDPTQGQGASSDADLRRSNEQTEPSEDQGKINSDCDADDITRNSDSTGQNFQSFPVRRAVPDANDGWGVSRKPPWHKNIAHQRKFQ